MARGTEVAWLHADQEPALREDKGQADGIRHLRIPLRFFPQRREQSWQIEPLGLEGLRNAIEEVRPDFVHFHGFGRSQSPEHFTLAKNAGARVLMTYHAPGQSCARWDLLYKGGEMCSGLIDVQRCCDCALHRAGLPAPLRWVLAGTDCSALAHILPYGAQHAFVRRRGMLDYQQRWNRGMAIPDRILWHAGWVRDLLMRNGVPEDRLQHLSLPPPRSPLPDSKRSATGRRTRRFLYLGRLIDIKGVHILIQAVRMLPRTEPIEVHIFGAKGPEEYLRKITALCEADPRVHLEAPVDAAQVPELLAGADAVIVPSLWPETGPYTVLEALWAGTPVVGSQRGGIEELIQRWGGGVLFEPGNARDLARILLGSDLGSLRRDPSVFRETWNAAFRCELDQICDRD